MAYRPNRAGNPLATEQPIAPKVVTRVGRHDIQPDRQVRILLVHDDSGSANYYRTVLHSQGFSVRFCSSYEAGIRYLDSESFDFVIVSEGGPSFDGKTVVEHAMQVELRLPVLVLTRSHNMRCYLEAMHCGAVDYLEESLTELELSRVIETHARPRDAMRAKRALRQTELS